MTDQAINPQHAFRARWSRADDPRSDLPAYFHIQVQPISAAILAHLGMECDLRDSERSSRLASLSGELDLSARQRVTSTLGDGPDGELLGCDLTGLNFLDASGIGALVAVHELTAQRGGEFGIVRASPWVRVLLTTAGVGHLLCA